MGVGSIYDLGLIYELWKFNIRQYSWEVNLNKSSLYAGILNVSLANINH